jgi:hypothetical protein
VCLAGAVVGKESCVPRDVPVCCRNGLPPIQNLRRESLINGDTMKSVQCRRVP